MEVINRVRVVASPEGFEAMNQALGRVVSQTRELAQATRTAEAATLSQDRAVERILARYNAQERQAQSLLRDIQRLEHASKFGAADAGLIAEAERLLRGKLASLQAEMAAAQAAGTKASATGAPARAGLQPWQRQQLLYQANDVVTSLASGTSPLQVLMQQGGQVAQVLQGEGGLTAALTSARGALAAIVSPVGLIVSGLSAMALAAGIAAKATYDFSESQRELAVSLSGLGRGTSATVADLVAIADASAEVGRISRAAAREVVGVYAGTGRFSPDTIAGLAGVTKNYATALTDGDLKRGAAELAKMFADPAQGAAALNAALGGLNERTRTYIDTLASQGRSTEAQNALLDLLKSRLEGAENRTNALGRAFQFLKSAVSDAYDALGRLGTTEPVSVEKARELLEAARADLAARRAEMQGRPPQAFGADAYLAQLEQRAQAAQRVLDEAERRQRETQARAEAEAADRASLRAGANIREARPDVAALEELRRKRDELAAALETPGAAGKLPDIVASEQARALEARNRALSTFIPEQQRALALAQLELEALRARSPEEKAAIARKREELALAGQAVTPQDARARVDASGARALAETQLQLAEAQKERLNAGRDQVASANLELQLLGRTAGEVARARLEYELLAQAKREAERNNTSVTDAEAQAIRDLAKAAGEAAQKLAEAKLEQDLLFERSLIGRSAIDQRVMQMLRSSGVDPGSARGQYVADLARTNDMLRDMDSLGKDALKGFLADIRSGTSASQALLNALNRIADKLLDMALEDLWGRAFRPGAGGGSAGGGSVLSEIGKALFGGLGGGGAPAAANSNTVPGPAVGPVNRGAPLGDVARGLFDFFVGKGLAPHQAAALVGAGAGAESGFNPLAVNASSGATGLFQHLGSRKAELLKFTGGDLADWRKQAEFTWRELNTTERRSFDMLRASTNPREAARAVAGFERAEGFSWKNPEGIHNWEGRLAGTERALAQFGDRAASAAGNLGSMDTGLSNVSKMLSGAGDGGFGSALQNVQASSAQFSTSLGATFDTTVANVASVGTGFTDGFGSVFSNILKSMSEFSSGGGGLLSGLFGGFTGFFAEGGTIPAGKWGIAGEAGPEVIRGPATVVPFSKMYPAAAPAVTVAPQISVHNYTGAQVETRRGENGVTEVTIGRLIDGTVGDRLARGTGAVGRAARAAGGQQVLRG